MRAGRQGSRLLPVFEKLIQVISTKREPSLMSTACKPGSQQSRWSMAKLAASLCCAATLLSAGCAEVDKKDIVARAARKTRPEPEEARPARAPAEAAPEVPAVAAAADPVPDTEAEPTSASSAEQEVAQQVVLADLPPRERASWSAKSFKKIAAALIDYRTKTKRFPKRGLRGQLSWRVAILPNLGYQELYDQFNHKEPWFTEHNMALLNKIPAEYQSPKRGDSRTNYLMVTGGSTMYKNAVTGRPEYNAPDGREHTILLVEVNDSAAVNWTEPKDLEYLPAWDKRTNRITEIPQALRGTSGGSFMTMFVDGFAGRISSSIEPAELDKMITRDKGDSVSRWNHVQPLVVNASTTSLAQSEGIAAEPGPAVGGNQPAAKAGAVNGSASAGGFDRDCWSAASVAMELADTEGAWQWARGAVAAGLSRSTWSQHFSWIPAFKRPSLGVHVAVAITNTDPKARGQVTLEQSRKQVADKIGPAGVSLLNEIKEFAAQEGNGPFSSLAETLEPTRTARRNRGRGTQQEASPVSFVTDASSLSGAMETAREIGADLLFYFDTQAATGGRGVELRIAAYDVFRGRRLLSTESYLIQSSTVPEARVSKNYNELKWQLADFIEDKLTSVDWPRISADQAKSRVESLAGKAGRAMPLIAITEMRYYQAAGLVDEAEILAGIEDLLGRDQAVALLLGSQKKQRRVLREYLPSDDPAEFMRVAEQQRMRRRDDDDRN